MNGFWILDTDGKTPIQVDSLEWAKWYATSNRLLKKDQIGKYLVSTVFLGIDHGSWPEGGLPVLWETMIFNYKGGELVERYTSHDDALRGHKDAVDYAKGLSQD